MFSYHAVCLSHLDSEFPGIGVHPLAYSAYSLPSVSSTGSDQNTNCRDEWRNVCLKFTPFSPWMSLFTLPSCIVLALGCLWCSFIAALVMCGVGQFQTRCCVQIPNTCYLLTWCLPEFHTDGLCWEFAPYLLAVCFLLWQVILLPNFEEMFLMTCHVYFRESSLLKMRRGGRKASPSYLLFLESPGSSCLRGGTIGPCLWHHSFPIAMPSRSMHWACFCASRHSCWLSSPQGLVSIHPVDCGSEQHGQMGLCREVH